MRDKELNIETVLSPAYRQIWDNSLLGVMVMDKEGTVLYVNRLLIRTDDLENVDILGKKMTDFYPMDQEDHFTIQTLKTGKPIIKKTVIFYTRLNKLVNSLCSNFPLKSKGRIEGVIHFSLNLQTSQNLLEKHDTGLESFQKAKAQTIIKSERYTFTSIIGESQKLKDAIYQAKQNSSTDFSAFIWAETGCGKELFAQALHYASPRASKPFVPINCAAIPENLLETTLFGTAKGAFTGAVSKSGLLEKAQGGTILLDELNSMSLELQAKLLRVIQEKKVRRVGAHEENPVDVKFLSTCNISPEKALESNSIRLDLFYRLAVAVIEIPSLRDRKSDIPTLCNHFLKKWGPEVSPSPLLISDELLNILELYDWPGNVRELEHTLKSCLTTLAGETTIYPRHLSPYFLTNFQRQQDQETFERSQISAPAHTSSDVAKNDSTLWNYNPNLIPQGNQKYCLSTTIKQIETLLIDRALTRAGFNISKAGRFLNLSPQALRYKIKKLKIHIPDE